MCFGWSKSFSMASYLLRPQGQTESVTACNTQSGDKVQCMWSSSWRFAQINIYHQFSGHRSRSAFFLCTLLTRPNVCTLDFIIRNQINSETEANFEHKTILLNSFHPARLSPTFLLFSIYSMAPLGFANKHYSFAFVCSPNPPITPSTPRVPFYKPISHTYRCWNASHMKSFFMQKTCLIEFFFVF